MEVLIEDVPSVERFVARDGQLLPSLAGVARYHARMDIKKAIGDDLHNTVGGNSFVHRFIDVATSADVAVILALAEAVIAIHQASQKTKRGVRNMTVPDGKQLRFRSIDGSMHASIESAVRADVRVAVHDTITRLSADGATALRVYTDADRTLSGLFNALSVKQLSRMVSVLTAFKINLDAAS